MKLNSLKLSKTSQVSWNLTEVHILHGRQQISQKVMAMKLWIRLLCSDGLSVMT